MKDTGQEKASRSLETAGDRYGLSSERRSRFSYLVLGRGLTMFPVDGCVAVARARWRDARGEAATEAGR